ncbi:conserved hypothetical protein [Paecilomyces variotii No. 5]|uniref:BZIP domain-containing protein n=1 Tax=Byssochlamys spectabilis (strain No. 5 / NBRC 109023) TaxID=1356009 RepID=V5I349_BYSSN|nr:conserved hypothetical protein [Paecilomyces variotii No. 5]
MTANVSVPRSAAAERPLGTSSAEYLDADSILSTVCSKFPLRVGAARVFQIPQADRSSRLSISAGSAGGLLSEELTSLGNGVCSNDSTGLEKQALVASRRFQIDPPAVSQPWRRAAGPDSVVLLQMDIHLTGRSTAAGYQRHLVATGKQGCQLTETLLYHTIIPYIPETAIVPGAVFSPPSPSPSNDSLFVSNPPVIIPIYLFLHVLIHRILQPSGSSSSADSDLSSLLAAPWLLASSCCSGLEPIHRPPRPLGEAIQIVIDKQVSNVSLPEPRHLPRLSWSLRTADSRVQFQTALSIATKHLLSLTRRSILSPQNGRGTRPFNTDSLIADCPPNCRTLTLNPSPASISQIPACEGFNQSSSFRPSDSAMADYNSLYQQNLYLSPDQQDLLLAALHSNNKSQKQNKNAPTNGVQPKREPDTTSPQQGQSNKFSMPPSLFESPGQDTIGSGQLGFEESPFLDFDPDVDFDFQGADQLIGDLPGSLSPEDQDHREKRKSMDGKSEPEEGGKKRRESSDDKSAKKPGRKPLTSEPTSKRKAQNRAAQRAFRERKEKHLKDLETKVETLEKASEATNNENGLLRAQVERLQVELREYRKRLSWVTSGNGYSPMQAIQNTHSRNVSGLSNDFYFDFPKFGDLPGAHIFNNGSLAKANQNASKENGSAARSASEFRAAPGVLGRDSLGPASVNGASQSSTAAARTPADKVNGTYASGAEQSNNTAAGAAPARQNTVGSQGQAPISSTVSNSDSPYSSSESHQGRLLSSSGTSPEPSSNSPGGKPNDQGQQDSKEHECGGTIDGEKTFCEKLGLACGNIKNPIPPAMNGTNRLSRTPGQSQPSSDQQHPLGLDWLSQQNGGQFDPVLFGDYRDPQEAVLSQDFGNFFNDAFPLPDLGSPFHNFPDVASPPATAPKKDLITEIDNKLDEDDEVVPGEDKSQMMTCTKIWYGSLTDIGAAHSHLPTMYRDRLQSMEKFRNGEIDVDSLCTELRTKARCSEGGVVVNQRDVEDIMGRVK